MKKIVFFIGLISCCNNYLKAQDIARMVRCPEDSIRSWMIRFHVPAVGIGVIENGNISSVKVYGALDNTIWNVASLTKPVTALTVLKLVQAKQWDLDESLSHYYVDPDIKDDPWTEKLTTRIMLSHQSGFLNWKRMEPDNKLHFHFEPGKGWRYSGKGYEYLRMAIEAKFHTSIQQLAEHEIFIPLNMNDTYFGWHDGIDSTRFAWGYDPAGKRNTGKYIGNNAADWLVTTIADYSAFAAYIMKGAGLGTLLFQEMTGIQAHFDTTTANRMNGMGLGWHVIKSLPNHEYVLTHDGSDDGVKTIVLLLPNSKRGIVVFTNGENGDQLFSQVLKTCLPDMKEVLSKYMREFR